MKNQVCTKFINLITEDDKSHKSFSNSTSYNLAMKDFPLLSCIFIWDSPVCFSVKKCPSSTTMYLYVSTNDPSTKYEISGVMWQVTSDSKTQLVSCEMSPKYFLGFPHCNTYVPQRHLLWYVLFSDVLSIFVYLYARYLGFYMFQWSFFFKVSGFGQFAMKTSSNPHLKHVFGFRPLR